MAGLAEERFLAAVAKLEPGAVDIDLAQEIATSEEFSWQKALDLAEQHWVPSLLIHNLRAAPALMEHFPAAHLHQLPRLENEASDRWALFYEVAAPVFFDLVSDGVRVLLLKGAALSVSSYPKGTRRLRDLDILIDKNDYERTKKALLDHGFFMLLRPGQTEAYKLSDYHEIGFAKQTRVGYLGLDVHWMMSPDEDDGFVKTSELFSRARSVSFGDIPLWSTSPEDTFINYANQIAQDHHRIRFLRAGDIYAIIKPGLDWSLLAETVRRANMSGRARLALGVASLMKAEPPEWILEELERSCPGSRRATHFLVDLAWLFGRRVVSVPADAALTSLFHSRPGTKPPSLVSYWYWRALKKRTSLAARLALGLRGYARSLAFASALRAVRVATFLGASTTAARLENVAWEIGDP